MYDLLKALCELPGPGGDEGLVQKFIAERWRPRVQAITSSPVGNLFAHVGGQGKRLLIASHADELCYVVRAISDDGYVWLASGQRDPEFRPGLRAFMVMPWGHPALILTASGPVEGVFATLTGHVLTPEQRNKHPLDWNDFWVDLGAASRDEVLARGVQIGDRVIWNTPLRRMGQLAYGKAIDDRVGLAIMDRLLDVLDRDRLAYDLTFVSTVQEELALIGAESVARYVDCEMAISLDIGLVGDVPGVDQRHASARLGAGPTLVHKDIALYDRALTQALAQAAQKASIPVQHALFSFYGSDSGAFMRQGMQAALVTVPTRYTHSPFEMIHLDDVEQTVQLLKVFLETQD